MNRMTKKQENGFYTLANKENAFKIENEIKLVQELGKYEDLMEKYNIPNIEYLERCIIDHDKYGELTEQLGCPLDVVFKAMTSEIYYDTLSGTGIDVQPFLVVNEDGMFVFDTFDETDYIFLNDYKQTWWLKEDKSE